VSEKDRGQSHAINKGFERATGELLGWLNSDDYYLPDALFTFAQTYLEDASVGAIYGHGHIADLTGQVVHKARTFEVNFNNLFEWFAGGAEFMQPSCLFTSQAWQQCGPLAEDLQYAMDLDLWIKIARNYKFQKVDELLSISLRHDDAKTYAYAEHSYLDVAMVYMRHGREDKARVVLEKQVERLLRYKNECEHYKQENRKIRKNPLLGNMAKIINKLMNTP
jgi:glycosyltransferase involved in cell wall biosynthesis